MKKYFNKDIICIIISIFLFILSNFMETIILRFAFLAISYSIVSTEIYAHAYECIKEGNVFNENILMIIATICAFLIGSFNEAIMIMLLFQIGEYFSELAVYKSKKSITELLDMRVQTANLLINDKLETVDIKKIKENDTIVVKPGEKIPLDGIIIEGNSHIDTSSITGESKPTKVTKNDSVISGCVNQENILTIKATTTYKNSTVTKIIKLIESSNDKKTNTEKFITKFAKIYTPVVVMIAIILVAVPIVMGSNIRVWAYRSLVFLVTSCPCALVISIPLGYFCGIGKASKEGILIKGSKELDTLNNIDYIALDKTGTVTEGVFQVTKIHPTGIKEKSLLQIAASAEEFSIHPIAKAIKNENKSKILPVKKYKEITGKGISCEIENKKILIGNDKLFEQNKVMILPVAELGSVIHIAIDKEYCGYIVISDKVKKTSYKLNELRKFINKELIILSGDTEKVVKSVANKVKIKKYFSSLLPLDKVEKVKELKKEGKVAFVGDGVNDAPVLKVADLGISMGQVGSDAAIEASDIVIMKDDLLKIKTAIRISRITKNKVVQNIVMALSIKLIVLLLGILGHSTIWMAVFADVGVTFISILNVLTIMWKKTD